MKLIKIIIIKKTVGGLEGWRVELELDCRRRQKKKRDYI